MVAGAALVQLAGRGGGWGFGGTGGGLAAVSRDRTEFLFDGDRLIDATPSARALLHQCPAVPGSAWRRLLAWLTPRFPGLEPALARLPTEGRVTIAGTGVAADGDPEGAAPLRLVARMHGPLLRLSLVGDEDESGAGGLSDLAAMDELALLRDIAGGAPMPVWRETAGGAVVWANSAYLRLATGRQAGTPGGEAGLTWPLPDLFGPGAEGRRRIALPGDDAAGPGGTRGGGAGGAQGERWFELVAGPQDDGRIVYALPADGAVQAEGTLHSTMQTLARTFAHLQTGLAIFDGGRRLVLFNPALADLTSLPPEVLITRPSLAAFLDALRERGALPEPRNYLGWRQRLLALEAGVAQGLFQETWWLAGGQTLRMTARPHPDGALALILEDISTEMTQSRRYRADLELGQAVVDAMPEAVAVFAASGTLVMTNEAYATLWRHDPGAVLDGPADVPALVAWWRGLAEPGATGGDLDRLAQYLASDEAGPVGGIVVMRDGAVVQMRAQRLTGGATLVGFTPGVGAEAELRRSA